MATKPGPDRIFITSNGMYSRVAHSRPAGEACTEYRKVKDHPARGGAAPDDDEQTPHTDRAVKPKTNRAARPSVRKGAPR